VEFGPQNYVAPLCYVEEACRSVENAPPHAADNTIAAAHGAVSRSDDDRATCDRGSVYDDDGLGVIGTACHRDNKSARSNDGDKQYSHGWLSLADEFA
jgi:hypothetical protein